MVTYPGRGRSFSVNVTSQNKSTKSDYNINNNSVFAIQTDIIESPDLQADSNSLFTEGIFLSSDQFFGVRGG